MSSSVLIIDGDPTFAESAQQALESAGLTVHVRFDASLEDVRTLRPRVLMLSAELPRGSGFGVCSRIRRDGMLRDIAILMTSSEATDQALARHARSAESADDYARKDIPMDELVDRVGHLLAHVPTFAVGDALPESSGTTQQPPPLPRSGSAVTETGLATGPVSTGTAHLLELWPREAFETEFRQALAANDVDPLPKGRSTPDQRLGHLRQLVKQHEIREKSIRLLWDQLVTRGQDLARRIVTVTAELAEHKDALDEAQLRATEAEHRYAAVQKEFHTFEQEIRRIFSEKDKDESQRQEEMQALTSRLEEATSDLAMAEERQRDDERRLTFLQEELETLTTEKDAVFARAKDAERRAAHAEEQAKDLDARVQTTEHIARERAEALDELKDQLDQATYERQNDLAKHQSALERARAETEAEKRRQRALLDEAEAERDRALAEQVAAWEPRLSELRAQLEHAADSETRLKDELAALRTSAAGRITGLERKQAELEQLLHDASAQANTARRHAVDAEHAARRAEQEAQTFRTETARATSQLGEALAAQRDLEAQVERLARERSTLQHAVATRNGQDEDLHNQTTRLRDRVRELELGSHHAHERLRAAENARADIETQHVGLLARQKALTEQFSDQEDELNEARFATESIRNALDALGRDLDDERQRTASPRLLALLDRIERVTTMAQEALPDFQRESTHFEQNTVIDGGSEPETMTQPYRSSFNGGGEPESMTQPYGSSFGSRDHENMTEPNGSSFDELQAIDSIPVTVEQPLRRLRRERSIAMAMADRPSLPSAADLLTPLPSDPDDEAQVTDVVDFKGFE